MGIEALLGGSRAHGQGDLKTHARASVTDQASTEGRDAFAHAGEAVALSRIAAAPVVDNLEEGQVVPMSQTHMAGPGVSVPQNVGCGFAQNQGQGVLVGRGQVGAGLHGFNRTPAVSKAFAMVSNSAERPAAR